MIGKIIHETRKKRGLSLSELAKKADISKSYLSNIEREINDNPSIQVLEKLSKVLGVDMSTLLGKNVDTELHLEKEWINLLKELKELGIEIEKFHEYKTVFEFLKWQNNIGNS
ncbi:transcriptional regulator [Bacillus sp. AFS001701]|uniref:helix-turn-helix domain-containing protein n=1 Tax=Bacillaceae TaxID=186817 RepID=UPI000BF7F273|nr:helix-turn-helix transcriptional regulator [Bacillus sp. AFS001701]PET61664.1 transcriptional regulator [Bacillus sp. AFS001701]